MRWGRKVLKDMPRGVGLLHGVGGVQDPNVSQFPD